MVCKKLKWRFFILLANSHNHDIIKHSNNAIEKGPAKAGPNSPPRAFIFLFLL